MQAIKFGAFLPVQRNTGRDPDGVSYKVVPNGTISDLSSSLSDLAEELGLPIISAEDVFIKSTGPVTCKRGQFPCLSEPPTRLDLIVGDKKTPALIVCIRSPHLDTDHFALTGDSIEPFLIQMEQNIKDWAKDGYYGPGSSI